MAFSKRGFLFKDDFNAVIALIIGEMLVHDEEMISQIHSFLEKGAFAKKPWTTSTSFLWQNLPISGLSWDIIQASWEYATTRWIHLNLTWKFLSWRCLWRQLLPRQQRMRVFQKICINFQKLQDINTENVLLADDLKSKIVASISGNVENFFLSSAKLSVAQKISRENSVLKCSSLSI